MVGISIDWKVASIIAMLALAAYNLMVKDFFNKGNDWRAFIPIVFVAALVAFAYFLLSYKDAGITTNSVLATVPVLLIAGVMLLASLYAMSQGSISVIAAILTIAVPLTALLAAYLLPNESLSQTQWIGVLLAMVSVYLVSSG